MRTASEASWTSTRSEQTRSTRRMTANALQITRELTDESRAYPVVYIDCRGHDLLRGGECAELADALVNALETAGAQLHVGPRVLQKIHIGEARCTTRMRPACVAPAVRFAAHAGGSHIVTGDTTVAYTGPRGARENPRGATSAYEMLARENGWGEDGETGVPFAILDRPESPGSAPLGFECEEEVLRIDGVERFSDFHASGGFLAADTVVNHAHLTLHGLAGFAGCIKSLAMGCSSLTGKLRMHQSLLPAFTEACSGCGRCVKHCPEQALAQPDHKAHPAVDPERCIGCGECVSICRRSAVELHGEDIHDWTRGAETMGYRMADYVMGLMSGRWERSINVLHLYGITPLCDCVDERQQPLLRQDLGFVVGMNPFAVDAWGARLVLEAARAEKISIDEGKVGMAYECERYVAAKYGLVSAPTLQRVSLSGATGCA
ncbi:MAG: DUF362 domain-containing protein [Chitinivibrionales bacterium]|nr:DUF362 domain-containing protein [Chitinivibrionales bacterium]